MARRTAALVIVDTIVDALAGLDVSHGAMPVTAKRVWRAIHAARTQQ